MPRVTTRIESGYARIARTENAFHRGNGTYTPQTPLADGGLTPRHLHRVRRFSGQNRPTDRNHTRQTTAAHMRAKKKTRSDTPRAYRSTVRAKRLQGGSILCSFESLPAVCASMFKYSSTACWGEASPHPSCRVETLQTL